MTAEVAIINRHAIALAADSAVTVGREKVWTTANKIVSLGPKHDIAVMVHGAGDYLGLDWEAVVKEFRRASAADEFKTVDDCAAAFRTFLLSSIFSREDRQRFSVIFPVFDIITNLARQCPAAAPEKMIETIKTETARIRTDLRAFAPILPNVDKSSFGEYFREPLVAFARRDKIFGAIADDVSDEIIDMAYDYFRTSSESRYASGVVVTGFGSDEYFPNLVHFTIDGRWGEHLRWWKGDNCKNLNDPDTGDGFPIIPFAQDDMSFLFMAGISLEYLNFLRSSLTDVLEGAFNEVVQKYVAADKQGDAKHSSSAIARELVASIMDNLMNKVRTDQYLPINQAVSALPKEEMALLAEALVDITSLKRKVDSQLQSVGGPVDVAVISKGDGFVWMKRKHYFDGDKNYDYFARKKRLEGGRP